MSGYVWAVEHRRIDGYVLDLAKYDSEREARTRVASCNRFGGCCVLMRAEVGPWLPVGADGTAGKP